MLKTPIHSPNAASNSATPIARPIAMTPTSAAMRRHRAARCRPGGVGVLAAVAGGVAAWSCHGFGAPSSFGWAEREEMFPALGIFALLLVAAVVVGAPSGASFTGGGWLCSVTCPSSAVPVRLAAPSPIRKATPSAFVP